MIKNLCFSICVTIVLGYLLSFLVSMIKMPYGCYAIAGALFAVFCFALTFFCLEARRINLT